MDTRLQVLTADQVKELLPLDELARALETALVSVSDGTASVPPRIAASTELGLLAAMPGHVPGLGLAAKLVSVFPHNSSRRLPNHQALVAAFDPETGAPVAIMDGTYITAIRTGMTSAIVARALARRDHRAVAVLGAGVQGESHVRAFTHLAGAEGRSLSVRIWSRNAAAAATLAASTTNGAALASAGEAVEDADVVFCCTDAAQPVVLDSWIGLGVHVSSVGSGAELPRDLISRARVFVESREAAVMPRPAGAAEVQGADPATLVAIGEVFAGRAPARISDEEVTVFKSTGHAAEDVAAASVVLRHLDGRG